MAAVREELELALRDTLGESNHGAVGKRATLPTVEPTTRADDTAAAAALERDTDLDAAAIAPLAASEAAMGPSAQGADATARARSRPRRANVWLAFAVLGAALVAVFVWLPRFAPQPSVPPASAAAPSGTASSPRADERATAEALAAQQRELDAIEQRFAAKLADLEQRGAAVWGGPLFAAAKALGADAQAARRAGRLELARDRATTAERRLERVAADAAAALAAQLAAGQRALDAGQAAVARQAFELALRIEPGNAPAQAGLRRAGGVDQWLPVLAAADNAAAARDWARAIDLYERVLRADPQNASARAGLEKARRAAGNDAYARALGDALAALRAGRLDAARAGFERARMLRPDAPEVAAGLAELRSALAGRDLTGVKARAEGLEAHERWADALAEYERLLRGDPSLEFARAGRERVAPRARLATALQALIEQPARLAAPEVRAEADRLLAQARAITGPGPVLRSQVSRLELLLAEYDQLVRLVLESDGATQVSILRVGEYGGFLRRELELRPGRYTLVGTRNGYRDARREVTLVPGGEAQVIDLRCTEPIE
jgi:hypothetical protein